MGCTQSKIEHEETVTRCKDRKQFMKDAVQARNVFASAHSAYAIALKNTGAALSDFGEDAVNDIHGPSSLFTTSGRPPVDPLPPPPPPPNIQLPLQRAATMPEFAIPKPDPKPTFTIQEEDEVDGNETPENDKLHQRHHHRGRSAGVGGGGARVVEEEEEVVAAPEPPPSPPRAPPSPPRAPPVSTPPPPPPASKDSTWDYFFNVQHMPGTTMEDIHSMEGRGGGGGFDNHQLKQSEHVHGDVGSTSSSSGSKVEHRMPEKVIEPEPEPEPEPVKPVKKVKQAVQMDTEVPVEPKRVGLGGRNGSLLQILNELDDKFLKASESAYEVSKILEANRMHYHSNFADNRGHIDHSAKLMRVITWNRSFKGMENADDVNDDVDANETLASVLDKLLAWEKKLYDEVKAGELMRLEYQKKVDLLNKRRKHRTNSEAFERAKAAVGHLHTRIIVDVQSMDSTVSEISQLRDDHLYPKLVSLVGGMARMWESMCMQHRSQMENVEDLKSLDVSQTPVETSEQHHKSTIQLWAVAEDWHSQFRMLVTQQKQYILALNSWLKLNLIPIESSLKENVSSPPRVDRPPIQSLLIAWHDLLEKLPDVLARDSIASFAAIMKDIMVHQQDERKQRMKCEEMRKDVLRKKQAFEEWHEKYKKRRMAQDVTGEDGTEDINARGPVEERELAVESMKKRLEVELEAYQKLCKQVRQKSLGSLKSHLPVLFRSMSEFSLACSDMYKRLLSITESQEQTESLS